MKKILILLVLLAGCTTIQYEEHTEAGSKYVFGNGLTLLLKQNPDTGMTAIDLLVKKSIATDGEKHGLGSFTNRMILAGTTKRTRDQITKEIEEAGGTIEAKTFVEYSEIIIEIPSDSISTALEILQDVILNPTFDTEEIERERKLILGEIEAKKDQPNSVIEEVFMTTFYQGHPYQHPPAGYKETIEKITHEDLVKYYKQWYAPNNIVIAVAGNIREKSTVNAIHSLFRNMQSTRIREQTTFLPQRSKKTVQTKQMNIESFYINQGYQLIPATHEDFPALKLSSNILGAGSGSRLFYELRDKRALAYTAYAITPSVRSTGFMKITMMSRGDVKDQALGGITEQVELLRNEKVSEEELAMVKQKLKGFYFLDHQKTKDQANYLALYEIQGLGYEHDINYPKLIDEVTSAEVQYVANKYFVNPAIAIAGPFEERELVSVS
ncbi:hypothetical protein COV18_06740 [Candidatus Woesearchaeota archaeon CG10_big_fil_rev_8_21_14_0_10_37_12]|nr:MAG: hypothetical protein COV18_06740 [Candidatus Woesearchaeota archaeon CG10_big_fil_rev_8_21_14_0_10_37_12]